MTELDHTHARDLQSWVASAEGSAFPIQNLPLGVFDAGEGEGDRIGIAIGDRVLDVRAAGGAEGVAGVDPTLLAEGTLNALLGAGPEPRRALRRWASALLSDSDCKAQTEHHLRAAADVTMRLPAAIGDYTDFYVGIHHATNVGKQFRPDNPLLPNYKWVPIGYHGRASSVVVSGTPVRRPQGQTRPAGEGDAPTFGPTKRLDYELELGLWVGEGNTLGEPIPIGEASRHIAGFCLLNDWSARDMQAWEYQPLGPFLAKNFGTTVSPWIVTPEALAPFRIAPRARPSGDPAPLPYLDDPADRQSGSFALELEVTLATQRMRDDGAAPHRLSLGEAAAMYWTPAQILAHHASNGCNLRPGDLLGTGTISGADADSLGSLLEITRGGAEPLTLPTGEQRTFLEDGDEVTLTAWARREGHVPIGFGDCRGTIRAA